MHTPEGVPCTCLRRRRAIPPTLVLSPRPSRLFYARPLVLAAGVLTADAADGAGRRRSGGRPVGVVRVAVVGPLGARTVFTDGEGRFTVPNLPSGTYRLLADAPGLHGATEPTAIAADEVRTLTFRSRSLRRGVGGRVGRAGRNAARGRERQRDRDHVGRAARAASGELWRCLAHLARPDGQPQRRARRAHFHVSARRRVGLHARARRRRPRERVRRRLRPLAARRRRRRADRVRRGPAKRPLRR